MASDQFYVWPPKVGCVGFTKEEWERAEKAVQKLREKAAAKCRLLVVDGESVVSDEQICVVASQADGEELLEQKLRDAERIAAGFED